MLCPSSPSSTSAERIQPRSHVVETGGGLHAQRRAEQRAAVAGGPPSIAANTFGSASRSRATDFEGASCGNGFWVTASDGGVVLLPPRLVDDSGMMRTIVADDLAFASDSNVGICPESAAGTVSFAFPASTLSFVAHAFDAGGFPLALRWERGDRDGMADAVSVLSCAQFLDSPLLVSAACIDLAASAVLCRNSAEEVLAYLCALSPARSTTQSSPSPANASREDACVGENVRPLDPEMRALISIAPSLGDRGQAFVQTWADEQCPLSRLPADVIREVLLVADSMTRQELGVQELCEVAALLQRPPAQILDDRPVLRILPSRCPIEAAQSLLVMDALRRGSAEMRRMLDVVSARSQRYQGSRLIVDGLIAMFAAASYVVVATDLQLKAMHILTLIAHPGDTLALTALMSVLEGGHLAGAAFYNDGAPEMGTGCQTESASGTVPRVGVDETPHSQALANESREDDCARRMGLDDGWALRVGACTALEALALPGDSTVVIAAAGLLGHGFSEVRYAAVQLVSRLGQPGCKASADALVRSLRDDDWRVREAAGVALAALVAKDGEQVAGGLVQAVCQCLSDGNPDVRQSVRAALQLCVKKCGAYAIVSKLDVETHLQSSSAAIRETATETLGEALGVLVSEAESLQSDRTDTDVDSKIAEAINRLVDILGRALVDHDAPVRQAAARAFSGQSLPGAVRRKVALLAIDALGASREVHRWQPTQEALNVLRSSAVRGDETAVAAARAVLERAPSRHASESSQADGRLQLADGMCRSDYTAEEVMARRAACLALMDIAEPGDSRVLEVLVQTLSDPDAREDALMAVDKLAVGSPMEVIALKAVVADRSSPSAARGKALRCLTRTAEPAGDSDVLAEALSLLESDDPFLRGQALCTAARLAPRGEPTTKAAVVASLRTERQHELQERAMMACEALLERGDVDVIETIVGHVVRGEFCTRKSGLRTLERIAGIGNSEAIFAMLPWLEHGHWPQRQAALDALPSLVSARGHPEVIVAVIRRLADSDESCRQSACETLGKVAAFGDETSVVALARRLEQEMSWIVRESTVEAFTTLATHSQSEALLTPLLSNLDDEVQRAAQEALAIMAERSLDEADDALQVTVDAESGQLPRDVVDDGWKSGRVAQLVA